MFVWVTVDETSTTGDAWHGHDVLGLRGHDFQSLYHFTIGIPVEDSRLTSEPGYRWERR